MKKRTSCRLPFIVVLSFVILPVVIDAGAEDKTASEWHAQNIPFRVLSVTSDGSSMWICGTDESIAVSPDSGEHWQIRHKTVDGAVLLNIGFANDKFGYAAGTGGLFLTTEDGGQTWAPHSAGKGAILQVSFSDTKHGLIRTFTSLLFTTDGGAKWEVVPEGQNSDDIKHFPYTFSLVALDSAHMAVMMKAGSAQYEGQRFLVTEDSGKSWKFVSIPNTTLYSFLRVQDKYWTVGTEVIHKDQPGGGYGVPAAFYSSDGVKWDLSNNDLSECKLRMCIACTAQGCLSANGTITELFSEKTSYREFSPIAALTSRWAAGGSAICYVGNGLQCAGLRPVVNPSLSEGRLPVAVAPGPLGTSSAQGSQCVVCGLDQILIDKKAQGPYTIKLTLDIAKNGVVRNAVAEGAPTPEVKSRIEQQAEEWIFDPYLKDGVAVSVKLNTSVHINVIRPR